MSRLLAATRLALTLLPLALTVGCDVDNADPARIEARACPSCGSGTSNSPAINNFGIPELHLDRLPNASGVMLAGIIDPKGNTHHLRVIDDEFVVMLEGSTLTGPDLIGWKILLKTAADKEDEKSEEGTLEIEISAYDREPTLSVNGADISTYGLQYAHPINPAEIYSVCPGASPEAPVVTLTRGETYDRDLKLVNPGMTEWVTLACADEAVFKMKRMNYGPNADFNGTGLPATVDQRQATLKMITADYCGGGNSYTAQSTQIVWRDAAGTVGPATPPAGAVSEAYWTADGALCLDRPRLASPSDVASECSLPSCAGIIINPLTVVWRTHTPPN